MCMFLLAAVIFGFSVRQIADPDIWWHLRNADYLFQHHSFPSVDTLSFTAAGSPWMNFEWLSEVPFFLAFKAMGLRGVLLVYFALLVLIYTGVYYRSCRAGADCKDATVVTLLAIFLGAVSIGPRTLLFGWLCMVAAAAGAGPFSADRKRPLASATDICLVDQLSRLLGLWSGCAGNHGRLWSGGGRMGSGCGDSMDPAGVKQTLAGLRALPWLPSLSIPSATNWCCTHSIFFFANKA